MARKKSKPKSKPASKKKTARRSSAQSPSSKQSGPLEFDDIELLNAHRYPDSISPAKLTRIRKSRAAQERLKQLLKAMPSNKATKERDISVLLEADPEEAEGEEYEYEYIEENAEGTPPSKIGKFFRRHDS